MKRASDEPSTSTGKRARPTRFTVQQVVDILQNSDSDEGEFDQEYVSLSDSSDNDYVDEALNESDDSDNFQNFAQEARQGGRVNYVQGLRSGRVKYGPVGCHCKCFHFIVISV